MNGLNFHEEMVAKISNGSEIGSLGKTYTQSYNDWLDKHDAEIRVDERKKVLEDVCGVLADEIWNRAKTKDDHLHNHCIRRCIALVNRMKEGAEND